jgi:hypothetical protein
MFRLLALLILFVGSAAHADEGKTLSGTWSASPMQSVWNVGDWGDACGPKPGGGGAPGGTATIVQKGGELSISGAGRNYSTAECWEQFPGLSRQSHSGGKRGWRTVCRSGAGDPRQATIVTTLSASDGYISFDETGQYQFVVQGQNCTASVRRSRSFRLIQREGEAATTPAPSAASLPTAPAPTAKRCANPGAPAKLEVRPSRKLMRAGEAFSFRALVMDGDGCAVGIVPTWQIVGESAKARLSTPGKIEVEADAPESAIQLRASVGSRSVQVVVEVVSQQRYEALLGTGAFTFDGESTDAAVAAIATESVGSRATLTDDRAGSRRTVFVAVIGGAALVLGLVGVILVVRGRRRRRGLDEAAPGPVVTRVETVGARDTAALVCPTCREEYPPSSQFCANDGNRLVLAEVGADARGPTGGICPSCGQGFDPGISVCPRHHEELVPVAVWLARDDEPATGSKICPVCGTQYPSDGRFCGTDGAALVPVN